MLDISSNSNSDIKAKFVRCALQASQNLSLIRKSNEEYRQRSNLRVSPLNFLKGKI